MEVKNISHGFIGFMALFGKGFLTRRFSFHQDELLSVLIESSVVDSFTLNMDSCR